MNDADTSYARAMRAVLHDPQLLDGAKTLYGHLLDLADSRDEFAVPRDQLARATGQSKGKVERGLASLTAHGWLHDCGRESITAPTRYVIVRTASPCAA